MELVAAALQSPQSKSSHSVVSLASQQSYVNMSGLQVEDEYSKAAHGFLVTLFGGETTFQRWLDIQARSGCNSNNMFVTWLMDIADTILSKRSSVRSSCNNGESANVIISTCTVHSTPQVVSSEIVEPPADTAASVDSVSKASGQDSSLIHLSSEPESLATLSDLTQFGAGVSVGPSNGGGGGVNKRKREHPTRLPISKAAAAAASASVLSANTSPQQLQREAARGGEEMSASNILTSMDMVSLDGNTVGGIMGDTGCSAEADTSGEELLNGLNGFTVNMLAGGCEVEVGDTDPEGGGTLLNLTTVVSASSDQHISDDDDEATRSYQGDDDSGDLGEHLRSLGYDLREYMSPCGSVRASSRGTISPPLSESILSPNTMSDLNCITTQTLGYGVLTQPSVVALCSSDIYNNVTGCNQPDHTVSMDHVVGRFEVVQNGHNEPTAAERDLSPEPKTTGRRKKQQRKCTKKQSVTDQDTSANTGAHDGDTGNKMVVASSDSFIERDLQFHCGICRTQFRSKASVKRHLAEEHSVGQTGISCSVCGKLFKRKDYLRDHMVRHTGATPFQCPTCGEKFSYRAILSTHMRSKHKDDSELLRSSSPNGDAAAAAPLSAVSDSGASGHSSAVHVGHNGSEAAVITRNESAAAVNLKIECVKNSVSDNLHNLHALNDDVNQGDIIGNNGALRSNSFY